MQVERKGFRVSGIALRKVLEHGVCRSHLLQHIGTQRGIARKKVQQAFAVDHCLITEEKNIIVSRSELPLDIELCGWFDQEQTIVLGVEAHHIGTPGLSIGLLDNAHSLGFEILVQG